MTCKGSSGIRSTQVNLEGIPQFARPEWRIPSGASRQASPIELLIVGDPRHHDCEQQSHRRDEEGKQEQPSSFALEIDPGKAHACIMRSHASSWGESSS